MELRQKEGWRFKYEELLDCGMANFTGAKIHEGQPAFSFTIVVQEFEQKINVADGSIHFYQNPTPKEGEKTTPKPDDGNRVIKSTYQFTLARHENPDIELTGHYWVFSSISKIDELKQLV